MGFEDDLRRIDEHIADARRMVHRQKGLIIRLLGAGVSTWDAQKILWLLESNLRRLEEHRERLRANVAVQQESDARQCADTLQRTTLRRSTTELDAGWRRSRMTHLRHQRAAQHVCLTSLPLLPMCYSSALDDLS